jgi:hypothetical protein
MAAVVAALHFLSRRRPRTLVFPTTRFIPDRPRSARALATLPSDLWLLLLRMMVVLLLGAALARPVPTAPNRTVHVVLIDRPQAAASIPDSVAQKLVKAADLVIESDSTAGSLSAGLLVALRRAPRVANRGDSIALTIISPFAASEWDDATLAIRRQWKGRIALVRVELAASAVVGGGTRLPPEDPLAATLALLGPQAVAASRIARGSPTAQDLAWARTGGALVYWPEPVPTSWPRVAIDTIGGVLAGSHAVVAPFVRVIAPPEGDAVAAWADGRPAATENQLGFGCVRNVAIPVSRTGDFAIRPGMLRLARELLAPCSWRRPAELIADSLLDSLHGGPALLPATRLARATETRTPGNPWLLAASALVFLAEPLIRRRRGSA